MSSDVPTPGTQWLNEGRIHIIIVFLGFESNSRVLKRPYIAIPMKRRIRDVGGTMKNYKYLFFVPFSTPAVMLNGNGEVSFSFSADTFPATSSAMPL